MWFYAFTVRLEDSYSMKRNNMISYRYQQLDPFLKGKVCIDLSHLWLQNVNVNVSFFKIMIVKFILMWNKSDQITPLLRFRHDTRAKTWFVLYENVFSSTCSLKVVLQIGTIRVLDMFHRHTRDVANMFREHNVYMLQLNQGVIWK